MAYTHRTWENDITQLNADNLNNIEDGIQQAIDKGTENATKIQTNTTNIGNNTSAINTHTSNKSNPHSVTASQVGAYTKTETDINIDNASSAILSSLITHTNNKSNPHSVTASQIGTYTTTQIDNKISANSAVTHIANKSNPHAVTAEQVDTYNKATIDEKLSRVAVDEEAVTNILQQLISSGTADPDASTPGIYYFKYSET